MKKTLISFFLIIIFCITVEAQKTHPSCTRENLEKSVDRYLEAVIAHNPASIALANNAKFTENGQRLRIGDGLWNTASARGSYKLYIADPQSGQIGFFGTIRENNVPAILALRLKIKGDVIEEIESILARDTAGALRLEGLAAPHRVFLESIPAGERAAREDLIKTANMYFTGLEKNDGKGIYPFTPDCNRLENGAQTTNNPSKTPASFDISAIGCKEQFESGFFRFVTRIRDRRFVVIDEERGLVFTFVFFDHAGNVHNVKLANGSAVPINVIRPWTWEIAELFKVEKGLIRQVEAVACECPYGMNSGWSSWEDGLSDKMR
ncbi:MAG: hypothetical protein JXA06_04210 [Bacteroidetes bacterium]|nr:hypothetical protein [Bacteroidota bacterium]